MANYRLTTIWLLLISVTLLLSGCVSLTPPPNQNITNISQLSQWHASGRILLKQDKEKTSGYFYWQHSNKQSRFSINSFIGTNILTLSINDEGASLQIDGKQYHGSNADELVYRMTGMIIPVAHLSTWITGRQLGGEQDVVLNTNNTLKQFVYPESIQPWQVNYAKYASIKGINLPNSVSLKTSDTSIKLAISKWQF